MSFHVEIIPNQANKPAILLREARREGKRIRKKTLANLSRLPPEVGDGFRTVLRGGLAVQDASQLLRIERSWAHGHVAAVLGTCRQLGLERILHRRLQPRRPAGPGTRLGQRDACHARLAAGPPALDRDQPRQPAPPGRHPDPVRRELELPGGAALPAGRLRLQPGRPEGQAADRVRAAVLGRWLPLAVEVFPGNTADPTTVGRQVDKIRKCFGIARIALVGDRGMLTTARIRADLQPAGLDWISALTTKHLRKLVAAPGQAGQGQKGQAPLAADSLVPDAVAEITSPRPGSTASMPFAPACPI